MSSRFTFAFLLTLLSLTLSALAQSPPTLHYGLQSQLPPVARVNKTFIWQLLPDTFLSDTRMSYAALDMPDWLAFDANTLTFSGQPGLGDVGNNFVIVQANASGSAIGTQSGFHCMVVNTPAPVVTQSFANQLSDGAAVYSSSYLQADGSLRIPPRWSFSVGFQWNSFAAPDGQPIYYTAYRHGTTSLMEWLTFDANTVTFNGLAPSNTAYFEVDVFGSEYEGYGDIVQTLKLVIGTHSFIQTTPLPQLNATAREDISYTVPISGFQLDGRQVSASNLSSVVAQIPSNLPYLSYDANSRIISGTVPSELDNTGDVDIPVIFTSIFNDTIASNLTFHFLPQLFSNGTLPSYNIKGGQSFSYDLSQYLIAEDTTYSPSYTPSNASDWISFDAASKKLTGTPPIDLQNIDTITVNMTGSDSRTGVVESATAQLLYTDAAGKIHAGGKKGLSNGAKIALAIVFGIIGGLILLAIIMFFCRRYCHHEDEVDDDATLAAAMSEKGEKGKGRATPMTEGGRTSLSSGDSDRLSQAIAAAELSVAAALAVEREKPKRMNLMNVFGGGKKDSSRNMGGAASGRSLKELLGMTPSQRQIAEQQQPRRHDIIVVTDGDGYTYRPSSPHGDEEAGLGSGSGHSEGTRSSWDSQQSSSLFYSEESGSISGTPVQRPKLARTRDGTPRSVPRQRKDFQPYRPPPRNTSSIPSAPDVSDVNMYLVDGLQPSPPTPSRVPAGGIRIVKTRHSSGSEESEAYIDEYHPSLVADAAITMATLETFGNEHTREASSAASMRSHESRPISRPRLIAFTSERRGTRSDSPPVQRFPSQKGMTANQSAENSREIEGDSSLLSAGQYDDSTEDADNNENVQRYSTASAPYAPPHEGETSSPIFFTRPLADKRASPLSQGATTTTSRSIPSSMRSTRSRANSMVVEPLRIQLGAGEPFHFTAQINPPPSASIGSPGRDGPVRSTYYAYTDYPEEPEFDGLALPDWLHFDPRELEFWGIPRAADAGSIQVRVVERKSFPTPGSPSRRHQSGDSKSWNKHDSMGTAGASTVVGGTSDESEQIVGRFCLDVSDRRSVGSLGDVVAITY